MSEIEFLPRDDVDPPPQLSTRRPSARLRALALVALVAIGVGVRTVAARRDHHGPSKQSYGDTTDFRPLGGPGRSCYGAPACTVTARLPAAVTEAVRAHLHVPARVVADASTELIPAAPGFAPVLAARVFSVRLRGGSLAVDITPHVDGTSVFAKIAATASATGVVDGYAVRIDYRPDRPGPMSPRLTGALQALTVDRRLEAV